MTEEELYNHQAICDAATPGPWRKRGTTERNDWFVQSEVDVIKNNRGPDYHRVILEDEHYDRKEADADFLVLARDGLPAYIKLVRTLHAKLAEKDKALLVALDEITSSRRDEGIYFGNARWDRTIDPIGMIEKALGNTERLCEDEGCPHFGTPHICVHHVAVALEGAEVPQEFEYLNELDGLSLPGSTNGHVLYQTEDKEAPNSIRDSNGEVVLGLCKVCGKAEVELQAPCSGKKEDSNE